MAFSASASLKSFEPLKPLCFRGFYPVVIDVETAGFNAKTDALLEIAAITLPKIILSKA